MQARILQVGGIRKTGKRSSSDTDLFPKICYAVQQISWGTLRNTATLSPWHLRHRCAIELGNHLVSVRDNPTGFIVFLYSSKGTDQHSYPNENLAKNSRDDQQKHPGAETAPASESPPKPIPHWRPAPEETPGGCKC